MLGYIINCNTIHFINKTTSSDDFYAGHKLVLDVISDNMASLVQLGKYGATNASDQKSMGYYVTRYLSESYILQ